MCVVTLDIKIILTSNKGVVFFCQISLFCLIMMNKCSFFQLVEIPEMIEVLQEIEE